MTRIIVSCAYYRCRHYLREAVLSVLAQTHRDLILAVVNDGDPDEPWDEIQDIDDPRLLRLSLPDNRGPYFAHEAVRRAFRDAPYFAIQDADDVSDPCRFERLLRAIGDKDSATSQIGGDYRGASHDPRTRQLDGSFRHRFCHAGIHRMAALDAIGGYYGGYRVGWDSLIMNAHALRGGVAFVDAKLYTRRKRPDSLTQHPDTSPSSESRIETHGRLSEKYAAMFHDPETARAQMTADVTAEEETALDVAADRLRSVKPHAAIPIPARPRVVATMASLSSRERLLEQTVASLLPQVDVLCVYLNGHKAIPQCLRHPKVAHATLSNEAGWRTGEAKLLFWDREQWKAPPYWSDDDIALIVDDDIVYPTDYVARMCAALRRHPGAIVCVHGSIMQDPFDRYTTSRWIARARGSLSADAPIHVPGAGTMAFRRGDYRVDLHGDMPWSHCVDVCTAVAAKRQGVPIWAIARPEGWLHPLALPPGTGVFRQRSGVGNDEVETRLLKQAGPWAPLSPIFGFEARTLTQKRTRRR